MRIVDVWKHGNGVLAYCIGEGINAKFSCKEISINEKTYKIEAIDNLTGLNGSSGVLLKINGIGEKDIACGVFQVVS